MAQSPSTLMTAEEFERLPPPRHGGKFELVAGRVVEMTPPGGAHGEYALNTAIPLRAFVRAHGLGDVLVESGYILASEPDTVRGPDVSFVSSSRLEGGRLPTSWISGPPVLAIGVVSPNDTVREVEEKVAEYLDAGACRVWTVWPNNQTVTVHRRDTAPRTFGAGDVLDSEAAGFEVEGFELAIGDIFA